MMRIKYLWRKIIANHVSEHWLDSRGFIYGGNYYKPLKCGCKLIIHLEQDFMVIYDTIRNKTELIIKGVTKKKIDNFL